jgi:hypothetical protein
MFLECGEGSSQARHPTRSDSPYWGANGYVGDAISVIEIFGIANPEGKHLRYCVLTARPAIAQYRIDGMSA